MIEKPQSTEPNIQHPFSGFACWHKADNDIMTWSNRQLPRNTKLFVVFVIVFVISAPIAIFLSSQFITDVTTITLSKFEVFTSLVVVAIAWGSTGGSLFYLIRFTWVETITVSTDGVTLNYTGLLAPKEKFISNRDLWRLSFEKYGQERHTESRYTLNIFYDKERATLAYWMRNEECYQLFLLLGQIFDSRGWSMQKKTDYTLPRRK
ncbi:MAG: hypothetical protein GY951_07385 [Psychromonas sp.]|nr:hypothetical protein [Psychromonas sp.]